VGFLRRWSRRLSETDEERLAAQVSEWAATVPGAVRMDEAPVRQRVKLAGVVSRISVVPGQGGDSLEAVLTDGTGEVTAVWTGRRAIPGMYLGTRLVVEGVLVKQGTHRRMVNPAFEFSS
jgi:cytochrome c-type biogenesis protein CcmE